MNKVTAAETGGLTRSQVVAWRNAVFGIFGLCGIGLSTWVSRTPAIRDSLGATTAEMGWIVFGLAAGSIVGLVLSSHVLITFGSARTIAGAMIGGAVGLAAAGIGATLFSTPILVVAGLAVFGAGTGMCDVAMNVEGAAAERVLGRTVMPLFHAAFSVGTVAGAGLGAVAELIGVPIAVHFGAVAAVVIIGVLIAIRRLQPYPDAPNTTVPTPLEPGSQPADGWRSRLGIWRERRTILIGLVILGMAFAEGSANDWLALAMVDGHHVSNAAGAFVFGIFVLSMTVGRVAGVFLLDRFGRVPVLRFSAALAAAGLLVVIFVPNAVIAGIGVVLWGLGSALGFPVGMSAAADDPEVAAARVSAVATIGYFAFLVGPPSIGFLGGHIGLLHALLLVLILVALAGFTSGAAREPMREPARESAHATIEPAGAPTD
ncbi:MFS family permease [Nakamurella sp. UYEF19]|uniref:MFS transporter n=1 Tax=Nakamurella sp. UYEF19 TaxID=1756392 RepID=UPI00339904FA